MAALDQLVSACAPVRWLDRPGASLIKTLRKVWGDEAPKLLARLCLLLIVRGQICEEESSAAAQSAALAVEHLLPMLFRFTARAQHKPGLQLKAINERRRFLRNQFERAPCGSAFVTFQLFEGLGNWVRARRAGLTC